MLCSDTYQQQKQASVNDDSNSYKGERERAYSVCPYQGCGDSGGGGGGRDDDIVKGAQSC